MAYCEAKNCATTILFCRLALIHKLWKNSCHFYKGGYRILNKKEGSKRGRDNCPKWGDYNNEIFSTILCKKVLEDPLAPFISAFVLLVDLFINSCKIKCTHKILVEQRHIIMFYLSQYHVCVTNLYFLYREENKKFQRWSFCFVNSWFSYDFWFDI